MGLADALDAVLPTEEETLLLRACLWEGMPGGEAWERLRDRLGDPRDVFRGRRAHLRGLGPLLYEALRRRPPDTADRPLLTVLRTASVREEAREATFRTAIAETLPAEAALAGGAALVLKGAALAELAYPRPALRHTHDLDLWGQHDETRSHPTGASIAVHRHLFRLPAYRAAEEAMRARAVPSQVADVPARVLAPADMLLHVCVHAFTLGGRDVVHWVPDAWFAAQRVPETAWDQLTETARQSRLALPASWMLGWLADALEAPVPPRALAAVREGAAASDAVDRDTALACAWAGRGRLELRSGPGRRRARALARWALLPAPGYLRATRGGAGRGGLVLAYLARPGRYVFARLRGRTSRASATPSR